MEFNRGIAAIVGPNGSGKSNVADAIRWVMGEQSLKVLRGKKSEDVIFSGSDKKARLSMAEVSLTINNEDGTMPVDFPEVVITRRVYRNGEGEYMLNRKKVRLHDIILLLAKSNFGQRSYSVIGQGMIDSFLMATPQERKEFFDEAAGVRQFQIKKEQAQQKLNRTKENLQQAELLLQEIEPRLRTLTRQVHRLEKRETIEEELRLIQKEYYSNLWKEIAVQLGQVEKERAETTKEFEDSNSNLQKVQKELEKLESETSREEMFRQLQKDYNKILDEKNALLQEQAVIKGRWEIEATQAGEANRVWLTKRLESLARVTTEITEDLKPLHETIRVTEITLDKKKSEQNVIIKQFEDIEKKLLMAKERLETRHVIQIPEVKENLEDINKRYSEFLERLYRVDSPDSVIRLKRTAREIGQSITGYIKELGRSASGTSPEEVIKLQNELSSFFQSKDSLVNEINNIVVKLRTLQEKENILQDKLNEVEQERGIVVKELDRIKQIKKPDQARADLEKDSEELNDKIHQLDQKLKEAREKIGQFNKEEQEKKDHLFRLQKNFRDHQNTLNTITQQLNEQRVKQARLETRRDDLEHEMKDELPEKLFHEIKQHADKHSTDTSSSLLLDKIHQHKRQLELIGGIDEGVTEEYKHTNERHEFLKTQSDDLHQAIESLEKAIDDLEETIKDQFDQSFQSINKQFGKYFNSLFKGGSAKLILQKSEIFAEDEEDEDDEDDSEEGKEQEKKTIQPKAIGKVISGIDIQATPPGKRLSNINVLSGGEKALTSIALICAIIANNPSPFVVLDEVDAALDEANSIKYAGILDELSNQTQFITITHNRATMSKANILYGVTMQSDSVSKVLSVRMEEAEEVIKRHGNR